MDQTLAQILSELYQVAAERDRLRAENEHLRQVIDSRLPIHDGSVEVLTRGEVLKENAAQ